MFDFFKTKKNQEDKKIVAETKIIYDFEDIYPIIIYVKENIGIDYTKQKSILKSRIVLMCKKNNIYNFKDCLNELKNNNIFRQDIINYLTTNESFFYREFAQVASLVKKISSSKNSVNILCAPSATGEEPYSIVLALLEANVSKNRFKITGIDISSDAIQKSIEGKYNSSTVRNLSESILKRYFKKEDDLYVIKQEIKQQVEFKYSNIFDNDFKNIGKFDYIFSRNMLIYFDKETRIKAKEIFAKLLKDSSEPILFGHADFPDSKN